MGIALESDRYPDTGFSIRDTSPEINRMIFERTMSLTGEERFMMGVRMFDAARQIVWSSLPDGLSDSERKRAFFERMYGQSLDAALMKSVK